jgi:ATP synthase F1 complex assembly factor 1
MCLQKFYGKAAEQSPRRKLMEQFSQGDSSFSIEELLEEAEKF